ncbi:hypothetical protein KY285_023239 [Solanum tuberosum]|nr:hypothetical protein KY285_023239 [Solanum tuberosum]
MEGLEELKKVMGDLEEVEYLASIVEYHKDQVLMILPAQDRVTFLQNNNTRIYLANKIPQTPLVAVCLTWQGLYNGKVLGISRERDGLYLLQEQVTPTSNNVSLQTQADGVLWHLRLGHPFSNVMLHIPSISRHVSNNIQDKCHICPLAKHHRKPTYDKKYYSNFLCMTKTQFNVCVKALRSDNGTEFINSHCLQLLTSHGIIHQTSCPYTPQQKLALRDEDCPSLIKSPPISLTTDVGLLSFFNTYGWAKKE